MGSARGTIKVLFLSANPPDTAPIRVDQELRAIKELFREATLRDRIELVDEPAVRLDAFQPAIVRHAPDIVHWSGHAEQTAEGAALALEDDAGLTAPLSVAALARLFAGLDHAVQAVVLNACDSARGAEALQPYVGCVIGMKGDIGNTAAIAFARGFYGAIGEGKPLRTAFALGKAQIAAVSLAEADIPQLFERAGAAPERAAPPPIEEGPPSIHPRVDDVFVGRAQELARLRDALGLDPADRVCVLQGLPGVGKSYLADRFALEARDRFPGGYVEIALAAGEVPTPEDLAGRLAGKLRLSWGGPDAWAELRERLRARPTLVHLENVDADGTARAVSDLVRRLWPPAVVVSGRYRGLGQAADWVLVEVPPLAADEARAQLQRELARPFPAEDLDRLARELGYLPLALHLAAGYLNQGHDVDGFLGLLRRETLALDLPDLTDPIAVADHARARLSKTFELSLRLLADQRGVKMAGFAQLAFLPVSGFGPSLGAAVAGLSPGDFDVLVVAATRLSLLTLAPRRDGPAGERAWKMQPLLAELLRGRAKKTSAARIARTTAWFVARLEAPASWAEADRERDALAAWLAEVPDADAPRVLRAAAAFAVRNGPYAAWLAFAERALAACGEPEPRSAALGTLAEVAVRAGALDRAEQAALEKAALDRARGAERGVALALALVGEARGNRGDPREALRIAREEVIPLWERLGDARERAVALRKVADTLRALGERDEALRVLREQVVPAFERLGDERELAVALGAVVLLLKARNELDEALRVLREQVVPVFERLGEQRQRAVALRKAADLLHLRGDTAEALRVLRDDVVPALDRLGDARERAIAQRLAAELLIRQGDPGSAREALALLRDDVLPALALLGDRRLRIFALANVAEALAAEGRPAESLALLEREVDLLCAALDDRGARATVQRTRAAALHALGRLDDALRVLRDDVVPGWMRLGIAPQSALALERIAAIHEARGEIADALRVLAEEAAPLYADPRDPRALARVEAAITRLKGRSGANGHVDDVGN